MRRICGVLMALLLLAMPLLVADAGIAAAEVETAVVVWAQDAGPPLVIVASDVMETIAREVFTVSTINDPATVSRPASGIQSRMIDHVDSGAPMISRWDGNKRRKVVSAWRNGLSGAWL